MKKLLALLIATIMCFSLAACGSDTNEETSGTTNQTTNETTEPSNTTNTQTDSIDTEDSDTINLVGTWGSDTNTLTLNEDGTGSYEYESEVIKIVWEVNGNELSLRSAEGFEADGQVVYSWYRFEIITDNESIELQSTDSDLILTPAE